MNMNWKYIPAALVVLIIILLVIWQNRVPAQVVLQVPFTTQAPTDKWDRNEDCEETSISMANAFLNGQTQDRMSAGDALNAINNLKQWENANIGYNLNTGADATTAMAKGAFKLNVTQIKDFSKHDLQKALAKGHVVLLPINAKLLGNTYTDNGPTYHMIVVRGYNEKEFIINDPGTNSGNGNTYTFETLKAAAADWDQSKHAMDPTRKIALILSK